MGIGGEEDSEMAGRYGELGGSIVSVELHILAFVILLGHVLAVHLGFPSHLFVVPQRDLDIQIVAMRLHTAFGLLFALEINNIHIQILAIQIDFACRQFLEIIVVVELHKLFQSRYAVEIPISVFQFV